MPIHRQKQCTTPSTPGSTPEQTAPPLPDQQAFHQHLRELARGAIRVVLEGVMPSMPPSTSTNILAG